jgi:hypothetical protein
MAPRTVTDETMERHCESREAGRANLDPMAREIASLPMTLALSPMTNYKAEYVFIS